MTRLSDRQTRSQQDSGVIQIGIGVPDVIPFHLPPPGDLDGPDSPPPAAPVAVGLPCRRGTGPIARPSYTLCAVLIRPDPTDPGEEDYLDGQEMLQFDYLADARVACDEYAGCPQALPLIQVPGVSHLVVNKWDGTEMYRQQIRVRAA